MIKKEKPESKYILTITGGMIPAFILMNIAIGMFIQNILFIVVSK